MACPWSLIRNILESGKSAPLRNGRDFTLWIKPDQTSAMAGSLALSSERGSPRLWQQDLQATSWVGFQALARNTPGSLGHPAARAAQESYRLLNPQKGDRI